MLRHHLNRLLIALAFMAGNAAHAQNTLFNFYNCPDFLQSAPVVKIYAVPVDSVLNVIYKDTKINPDAGWLKKPQFIIDRNKLDSLLQSDIVPAGHYVYILLHQNNVMIQKYHKRSFEVNFINLGAASLLEVRNLALNYDSNVTVMIGNKKMVYDKVFRAFVLPTVNEVDTVSVRRDNDIQYYVINAHVNTPYRNHNRSYYEGVQKKFNGYVVTNKPKYMPRDTVKWKAYLLDPNTGMPATGELELSLSDQVQYFQTRPPYLQKDKWQRSEHSFRNRNAAESETDEPDEEDGYNSYANYVRSRYSYGTTYVVNTKVKPVHPGVYFSEFVVADSMDIDRLYNLILTSRNGTRLHTQLLLQDYLLKDLNVKVKADEITRYQPGDSIHIYAYASTANNLPLMDGTVSVTLTPNYTYVNNRKVFPDTMFHKTTTVSPEGSTVVVL